jgi:hypothetical protein
MRLWEHLWAGVLVSLAIGVFMIGVGGYYWAFQDWAKREQERQWNERVTGVKIPPPTQEQADQDWHRDFATGAGVSGVIWFLMAVGVFWGAWKARRRAFPGRNVLSADEEHPAEPAAADVTMNVKPRIPDDGTV